MEAILTEFEILFYHLHEVTGVNHEDLGENIWSASVNLQLTPRKFEFESVSSLTRSSGENFNISFIIIISSILL